ncbi:MAG: penicillin-binding transpeptidase domain-containing protein, partial [Planctomycetota bacterium]|nr:penicillin-binding transpeptidase domain-containing protein [Planctomycetota bacterium]
LCGLVMDPHTGEILAWANRPTHNANLDGEDGLGTFHGGYDYVAAGRYEVGSVFKPITVAWALDKGVVRADEIIPMPEAHKFPGCKHVIHDTHYVGPGTVVLLLEQSSNTGAAELARRLGAKGMQDMWSTLRLTQRPDIEFPRAVSGIVNPEVGTKRWPPWLYHRVAYGQGNSLTPLQLGTLYCALARPDARMVKPALLYRQKLRDPRGPRLCHPRYLPVIRQGLRQVVTQGTARKHIQASDYPIAGKTGTAQQGTNNICSFVGMAPAHDPQMVCLVMAKVPRDKNGSGGAVAAPAVARVLNATLEYIRLPKQRPVVATPERAPARVQVPRGNAAGQVVFNGTGRPR